MSYAALYTHRKRSKRGLGRRVEISPKLAVGWRRAYVETLSDFPTVRCIKKDGETVLEVLGEVYLTARDGRFTSTRHVDMGPSLISGICFDIAWRFLQGMMHRLRLRQISPAACEYTPIWSRMLSRAIRLMSRRLAPIARREMNRFLASVDPAAVSLVRRYRLRQSQALSWLTPEDPEIAKRRRQAVEIYPLLMANTEPWDPKPEARMVAEAIDQAKPLVDALALFFKVRRSTIRWFAGRRQQRWFRNMGVVRRIPMRVLDLLPSQLMPTCLSDMKAASCMDALLWSLECKAETTGFDVHAFIKRIPASIPLRNQPVINSINHVYQVQDVVSDALNCYKSAGVLFSGMGLSSLEKLSRDWHREVLVQSTKAVSGEGWGPGLEGLAISDGHLTLIELTNTQQLLAEGLAMQHCVGTYASKCVAGYARIISIRNARDIPTSTIELSQDGSIAQHRGYRNRMPHEADKKLASRLVQAIRTKKLVIRQWPKGTIPPRFALDMSHFWQERGFAVEPLPDQLKRRVA